MNCLLSCRMLFLVLFAKYNNVVLCVCVYIDRYLCLFIYLYIYNAEIFCFKDSTK